MTGLAIGYVNFGVRDFARAVAFYRDTLSLTLKFADEAFKYAAFDAGTISFAVVGSETVHDGDRHTGIGFCVADVDATHVALEAKGVRFTMPPSKQLWGGYMAMFFDPDGNVFYLDQLAA
ncbi:MAG: VOC family protein [Proteobacteria bacterium]|nr:VOC family protein [Pseudomonadota bacterium]